MKSLIYKKNHKGLLISKYPIAVFLTEVFFIELFSYPIRSHSLLWWRYIFCEWRSFPIEDLRVAFFKRRFNWSLCLQKIFSRLSTIQDFIVTSSEENLGNAFIFYMGDMKDVFDYKGPFLKTTLSLSIKVALNQKSHLLGRPYDWLWR